MYKTLADAFDGFANSVALFFFLWSIGLAMEASAYLIDEDTGQFLTDWARLPYGIGFLALVFTAIMYFRRRGPISLDNAARSSPDSYATEAIRRSALVAFVVTLILFVVLDNRADHSQLAAGFFVKLPGFTLLSAFSVSYFFLNRGNTEEENGEQETNLG
jgi:hypothetical protein